MVIYLLLANIVSLSLFTIFSYIIDNLIGIEYTTSV